MKMLSATALLSGFGIFIGSILVLRYMYFDIFVTLIALLETAFIILEIYFIYWVTYQTLRSMLVVFYWVKKKLL